MYNNKIRLSQDVLEKAELIAQEWGLKNARAAVEAVFRRYADEYRGRRSGESLGVSPGATALQPSRNAPRETPLHCEALDELDDLLGL